MPDREYIHQMLLMKIVTYLKNWSKSELGKFETYENMKKSISREMFQSKLILEKKILGKEVSHFCYPWFIGSEIANSLAARAGYRTLHYGIEEYNQRSPNKREPLLIRRISEEYLLRLPGKGQKALLSIWKKRLQSL